MSTLSFFIGKLAFHGQIFKFREALSYIHSFATKDKTYGMI